MRGMFAVALWTNPKRRLVLARDRMGIKPLYYCAARRRSVLRLGAEGHPGCIRRSSGNLSLDGLDCYLSVNYVPGPWTLIEGIEKVPPGHWLEWRNGKVRTERYWTAAVRRRAAEWTLEAAKEELDWLLRQSVREHLISDVPLGVWLSGGLDSSTILHYAAQASPARLKTFSVSFQGRSFDETRVLPRDGRAATAPTIMSSI